MGARMASHVTFTPDQNEKAYPARVKVMQSLQHIGYVAIPLGVVSVVVGIVVLIYVNRYQFPLATGLQIWSGLIIIAFGSVGLLVAKSSDNMRQDITPSMRKKLRVFNGIGTSIYTTGGMAFAWAITGTVLCAINYCSDPKGLVLALEALSIAMTLTMMLLAGYGNLMFHKNRKAFQILTCNEHCAIQPQQVPIYGQEKTPYGFDP